MGDNFYRTGAGGCTSLLIFAFVCVYSGVLFSQLINRENRVVNSVTKIDDLISNPAKYKLSDYNFLFSLYDTDGNTSILTNSSYFKVDVEHVQRNRTAPGGSKTSQTITPIGLQECGSRYEPLVGSTLSNSLKMYKFLCPKTSELHIGGLGLSTEYNYVKISIKK